MSDAQTTLRVLQPVELGGERRARRKVAAARRARDLDAAERRLDVLARRRAAFVAVLIAQQEAHLATGRSSSRCARCSAVTEAEARRASLAGDETRARYVADDAGIKRGEQPARARGRAPEPRRLLWGETRSTSTEPKASSTGVAAAAERRSSTARLDASPTSRASTPSGRNATPRNDSRESQRTPDLTVFAGPRRLSGPEETALVVGVSMPLPLWNHNRGAIEESEHRVAKLAAEQRSARVLVATDVAIARVALVAAVEESHLLRTRVLPGIESAVTVMRRGYEQGRFAQIEVLEAERARVEAREQIPALPRRGPAQRPRDRAPHRLSPGGFDRDPSPVSRTPGRRSAPPHGAVLRGLGAAHGERTHERGRSSSADRIAVAGSRTARSRSSSRSSRRACRRSSAPSCTGDGEPVDPAERRARGDAAPARRARRPDRASRRAATTCWATRRSTSRTPSTSRSSRARRARAPLPVLVVREPRDARARAAPRPRASRSRRPARRRSASASS